MRFVARILVPGAILVAGVVMLFFPSVSALGVGFILIAVLVWLTNFLARLIMASDRDRDRELQARETYLRTGSWPEQAPRR